MPLLYRTPDAWTEAVISDFDTFLLDHAAAEKKASGMALSMISHYPDRARLVDELTELAVEELVHFRQVVKLIYQRGLQLGADKKDTYIIEFRKAISKGSDAYFLDRLLSCAIIEARGAERFGLVANALPEGELKQFYKAITKSESRHFEQFQNLALHYFDQDAVDKRSNELLLFEAEVVKSLPVLPQLH